MELAEALKAALEEQRLLREQQSQIGQRVAELETEVQGLHMAIARAGNGAGAATALVDSTLPPTDLSRTDAIWRVLREAKGPMSPSEVQAALHDLGRDDDYNAVSAALAYLARNKRVHSVGRAQWVGGPKAEQVGDPVDGWAAEDKPSDHDAQEVDEPS